MEAQRTSPRVEGSFHKVALGLTKRKQRVKPAPTFGSALAFEEVMKQPRRLRGRVAEATCQIGGRSLCETPGILPSLPSRRPCGLGSGMFEGEKGEWRGVYVVLD